jgi:outer membrane protein OmpA-like peptidoglycan-associated protein
MRLPAPIFATCLVLLAACAGAHPVPSEPATGPGLLLPAELARVRCLLLAPVESATDEPLAAAAATQALEASIDPARTRVLPVAELRAMLAETPLELPAGVSGGMALELAELLGADGALYGAVEGRSRGREPGMTVTLRLILLGGRELAFAATAPVVPEPGEPLEAAVRRSTVALARPALDRLGSAGPRGCFAEGRRDALHAAAAALRPAAGPAAGPAAPAEEPPAPGAASLRTARQRDWARQLGERGRVTLEEVAFAGRSADLAREAGLADLALVLGASPGLTVRLVGYVDASGDPAGDARLSMAMAQAAARRLVELGVEASRIGVAGRGGESPLVPNFTSRGRAANRRIEASVPR